MRYRQLYYRAAFFLFCIAPTIYTIGYLVDRNVETALANVAAASKLPDVEAEVSSYLGLRVKIASLRYEGNISKLSQVELRDPETDALLATADTVDMYYAAEGQIAIEPEGVSVQANHLWRLAEVLHERVLRELPPNVAIEAGCPSVQLIGGPREESLADVNLSIAHSARKRVALLSFRPAWDRQREPLELEVTRDLSTGSPVASMTFRTGAQPFETAWFGFCIPVLTELGDQCTIRDGIFAATETDAGWESSVQGHFDSVALDRIVARSLRPYPLGSAQLSIDNARFQRGRLIQADGVIQADKLQLGWGILAESLPVLKLRPYQTLRHDAAEFNGQLHCRFSVRPGYLRLIGKDATMFWNAGSPLLAEPANKLPWSESLLELCRSLGMPPLDFIPAEFDASPEGVRIRDRST